MAPNYFLRSGGDARVGEKSGTSKEIFVPNERDSAVRISFGFNLVLVFKHILEYVVLYFPVGLESFHGFSSIFVILCKFFFSLSFSCSSLQHYILETSEPSLNSLSSPSDFSNLQKIESLSLPVEFVFIELI
jgi:hypothetical protein